MFDLPANTALYTAAQVRELDRRAIAQHGVSGFALMQRAAWAAFHRLRRRWSDAARIVVLCGPGNNGGDGYLLAALAHEAGMTVDVLALGEPRGDAELARATWLSHGMVAKLGSEGLPLPMADVYVDALFGTGLARDLDGAAAAAVATLNSLEAPVLALDIPSGLCADTGRVLGTAVRASATVSFIAWKRGQFTLDGLDHCGTLHLATLDLPDELYQERADARLLSWPRTRELLPQRRRNVHKGLYGHVLAIGGDVGMGGAIRLTTEAALRSGAGLVSVGTRVEHIGAINAARPEAMVLGIAGPQDLKPLLERASVIALGPGLGTRAWGHAHWHTALARGLPTVLDADALNLLAREPRGFNGPVVLTPHPGEAARLLGCDTATVQRDRFAAARALARRYRAVVVLKGAGTLIAAPDGELTLCPWGNPGMASGGMGDVLTGVIAGLLAQGLNAYDATCLGVALHARAGDAAAQARGMVGLLASDLFAPLQRELNPVAQQHD